MMIEQVKRELSMNCDVSQTTVTWQIKDMQQEFRLFEELNTNLDHCVATKNSNF